MHCASETRSCAFHVALASSRMTHTLSLSRAATPNHAFEGTAFRRRTASPHCADAAPQRKRSAHAAQASGV